MIEHLKISRGFTVPLRDGHPYRLGISDNQVARADRPCVVVWGETFDRMAAVVEAEIAIVTKLESIGVTVTGEAVKEFNDLKKARDIAVDAFRAHIVAAAEKGGA